MKNIMLLFSILSLSGCVSTAHLLETEYDITNVQAILDNSKVQKDKFTGKIDFVFPKCKTNQCRVRDEDELNNSYWKSNGNIFIRGWLHSDGELTYQVYTSTFNVDDWSFYNRAVSLNGKTYDANRIDTDVDCSTIACLYSEDYGFTITQDDILQASIDGFSFELRGKRHSGEYRLPKTYFQAILNHPQLK